MSITTVLTHAGLVMPSILSDLRDLTSKIEIERVLWDVWGPPLVALSIDEPVSSFLVRDYKNAY